MSNAMRFGKKIAMLKNLNLEIRSFTPFTNVVGLGRTLLALNLILTLATNSPNDLFHPYKTVIFELNRANFFHLFGFNYIKLMHVLAIFLLALTASGWRPRITGIIHLWVAWSFSNATAVLDGGDQVAAIIPIYLLPICLLDKRIWHWSNIFENLSLPIRTVGLAFNGMLRLQVAMIYFQASTAKFLVREWADGTALYYWLNDPMMGMPMWARPVFAPILQNATILTIFTFGVMIFEVLLFSGLWMNSGCRKILLPLGIAFHGSIIFFHGLGSFFLSMTAALILFLRPWHEYFHFKSPLTFEIKSVNYNRFRLFFPSKILLSIWWNHNKDKAIK